MKWKEISKLVFSDPNVNNSGDIELAYKNNDYITCSIPKNAAITINSYGNVGETVDGELNFIGVIDYNYNMLNKREPTMVTVKFSIVRGPTAIKRLRCFYKLISPVF